MSQDVCFLFFDEFLPICPSVDVFDLGLLRKLSCGVG